MMTVAPVEQQGVVVGEQKHKECCIVGEGGQRGRHGGIIGYREVLDEKERSWMRMTFRNTRRVAQKHKGLHHVILERMERKGGSRTQRFTPRNSVPPLEVPLLFVLLEYGLGVL